ncbi:MULTISPECIES: hypothetical protein [Actinosynnema]|uniref:hypothetical protein n=1 Tax=Actinosynnema TaxID=40566 RepID=UPI0020A41BAD|nr:hypothetical protein [Actinosynnema pretiosum]
MLTDAAEHKDVTWTLPTLGLHHFKGAMRRPLRSERKGIRGKMDELAATRHRRAVEAVVRGGLAAGDAGAIHALRAHVRALELDAVLMSLMENAIACMIDDAGKSSWETVVRCDHCGVEPSPDGVKSGLGLAVRALETAHRGDRAEARRLVERLLDLNDVDSRNDGLVWLLRVTVRSIGEVLTRDGGLPRVSSAD